MDSSRECGAGFCISEREHLIIREIGFDRIDSASSFVDYVSEIYGIAKSTAWYSLKKLKSVGIVYFAGKGEGVEPGLFLTIKGKNALRNPATHAKDAKQKNESSEWRIGREQRVDARLRAVR